MLNFTIKPGEYFMVGKDIRIVFLGGTAHNYRVMIEAPKQYNIVRWKELEKYAKNTEEREKLKQYYPEPDIPKEEMRKIMAKQKAEKKNGNNLWVNLGTYSYYRKKAKGIAKKQTRR